MRLSLVLLLTAFTLPPIAGHSQEQHRLDPTARQWDHPERSRRVPSVHRFFDRTNLVGISVTAGALAADGYSTCQLLGRPGVRDANPLIYSCRDVVLLKSAGFAGSIGIMYAFHRGGHHRMERFVPYVFATPSAIAASLNFRF
jgi:hypothetical protein